MQKKRIMQKHLNLKELQKKILSLSDSLVVLDRWKSDTQKVVFTNGCFDVFHYGHLHLLYQSKILGDKLIVGLNDDKSIASLKGIKRPIYNQEQRSAILSAISFVDLIIVFSEQTPLNLIKTIKPDIITKGSDYKINQVVGKNEVISKGGKVILIPLIKNLSSSNVLKEI